VVDVHADPRETNETSRVAAARAGDADAFRELAAPYYRELRVHCYRMLGSLHDAEDAVQETLLRAWRRLETFEARTSFRIWLYKIATNTCLNMIRRRGRVVTTPLPDTPATSEVAWLEPFPDALIDDRVARDPTARYELSESIALAFLAAIQYLPARQRAVLILRDALGWASSEVASLLDTTVPAVNSALQRARATLEERLPPSSEGTRALPSDEEERSLLRRYVDAWERADVAGLVALLREDAVLSMPPEPLWFEGRVAIGEFFANEPTGVPIDQLRLVATRANGQPALAAYKLDADEGRYRPYGMMVLVVAGDEIAEIVGFGDPSLFRYFALPEFLT
jgi:RNA polymerase sigma-70 factor (ECF subfamily)